MIDQRGFSTKGAKQSQRYIDGAHKKTPNDPHKAIKVKRVPIAYPSILPTEPIELSREQAASTVASFTHSHQLETKRSFTL